ISLLNAGGPPAVSCLSLSGSSWLDVSCSIPGSMPSMESKNGKRTEGGGDAAGGPKYSMFTWFVVLALLGVWSSVAVVYFDIVDYDSVIARAKEFHMNFSEVLQGKLTAYDADGDGDFDVEDAKVLLGKSHFKSTVHCLFPLRMSSVFILTELWNFSVVDKSSEKQADNKLKEKGERDVSFNSIVFNSSSFFLRSFSLFSLCPPAKKKKPKLLNTFDKTIKAEIDAAEKLRKKGKVEEALRAFETLVQRYPQSPRSRYGKAQVLAVAPGNGFAKVHYGFILKSENKIAESIPYLKEGLESGEPGTDDGRFYFHLGDALQRVGDNSAYHWYELGHQRGHFASVWQRSLYNVDGLKAQPWWTPKETGYMDLVKMLERNWRTIRDEALAVMDQSTGLFIPEEENLREKGEWGQYTLWQQGRIVGNSCQGVPKTCSLLERYPEATACKRGQIKFSVMQPNTHVWPHTGPTNCRLRMHLGLVIPKQGCRIRCTNQTREWEEGKVLIFDDSFEHEVWQEADSYRLIFIVDVWHPELTQYQRQTLSPI
uniref:Un-named hu7910 n=1 Tax=Echeneis naucrates TaxID=173247 RepID=A0A665VHQ0_ECHNA